MRPPRTLLRLRPMAALLSAAAVVALAAPSGAAGQFGGSGQGRAGSAVTAGGRVGYDFRNDAPVLGGFLRSDVAWRLAVQATGDLTFLDGLTERQVGGDVLIRFGSGLALGGGVVSRSTVFARTPQEPQVRETRTGYSVVALLGGVGPGRVVTGLELRFTSVDGLDSQLLAAQIGLPLLRW